MNVLILQNQVGVDGRSRVIAAMVRQLNEEGIIPTILTMARSGDVHRFRQGAASGLQFEVTPATVRYTRGCIHQMAILPILGAASLKRADVIINSNDSPYFLPDGPRYLHYYHDPINGTFSEALGQPKFGLWRNYVGAVKAFCSLSNPCFDGELLANSEFTRQKLRDIGDEVGRRTQVLYPPAISTSELQDRQSEREIDVVSIGTFSAQKRQLEQIMVARSLRKYSFTFCGSVVTPTYFKRCEDLVRREGLNNVRLVPDATAEQLRQIVTKSRMFIHTKVNEGFGIAVAEAIAAGCVPLVHDSGGPREIVPVPELRYVDERSLHDRLAGLLMLTALELSELNARLRARAAAYTAEAFRKGFSQVFKRVAS